MRTVEYFKIYQQQDFIIFTVKANAFLHHMVRNMVGTLLLIGEGRKNSLWAKEVLLAKDRSAAGPTAAAQGLYLTRVDYPEKFMLPNIKPRGIMAFILQETEVTNELV